MGTGTSPVRRYAVFSLRMSPTKFCSICDDSIEYNKNQKGVQTLYKGDFGMIEYNEHISDFDKLKTVRDKVFVDIIREQCGLPEPPKDNKPIPLLYILVRADKKHFKMFGEWLSRFWTEDIPLTTKDGGHRLTFNNYVSMQKSVLADIGFVKTKKSGKSYYFNNWSEDMKNEEDFEIENDNEEEIEVKPKKKEEKQPSKKDGKPNDKNGKPKNKKPNSSAKKEKLETEELETENKPEKQDKPKDQKPKNNKPKSDNKPEKEKPKNNKLKDDKPKQEKPEEKPEKRTTQMMLDDMNSSLRKYLNNELKNGAMIIRESDVQKALKLDVLPKNFVKKLAQMLEEKFGVQWKSDDEGLYVIVWKQSKKRVPISVMKN